jgi:hypothetical protein
MAETGASALGAETISSDELTAGEPTVWERSWTPPRLRRRARVAGTVAAALLRVAHASWRRDDTELKRLDSLLAGGGKVVVAFWHGKFFPLFSLMAGRHACVFASQSFNGQVIAEICRWFGYDCVLLPANGGVQSRAMMIEALSTHNLAAIAVDGPGGPYHVVKRGAIELASELGFAILPVSAACGRRWIDRRRWDRREVPGIFTRIALALGEPIAVPRNLGHSRRVALRANLRDELEALDRRAAAKVGRRAA